MDTDIESPIIDKAKEFLEAPKKYSENLSEILEDLKCDATTYEATLAVELIFSESLKNRMMFVPTTADKAEQVSEHIFWFRSNYEDAWSILLHLMADPQHAEQATITLFRLLGQEGKYPVTQTKKGSYYFPHDKLEMILKTCFNLEAPVAGIQTQIDEYTNYLDVAYYLWLLVPSILQRLKNPTEKQMANVLETLKQIPVPSEEELQDVNTEVLLCFTKSKTKFKPKYSAIKESIQNLWNVVHRWSKSNTVHMKILVLLIENLMPHLNKPVLTMDYLMESLNAGGAVPLLALQGIFTLVKDHNLEYPNIYGKLYSFFQPSIFYTKYKNRLYVLSNVFLSSTHLPEVMIASFIKRFAKLCLIAPPQDIVILSAFIGNLLIRHSGLRKMIQHPTGGTIPADPFLENELDPMKTKAIESSLWELEMLKNHVLPTVSNAVSFISKPLPNVEWDITNLIESTYESIFDKESKNKFQKVSLTFEQPDSFVVPRTEFFPNLWYLDE